MYIKRHDMRGLLINHFFSGTLLSQALDFNLQFLNLK